MYSETFLKGFLFEHYVPISGECFQRLSNALWQSFYRGSGNPLQKSLVRQFCQRVINVRDKTAKGLSFVPASTCQTVLNTPLELLTEDFG
jgi:hypothetical protein